MSLWEKVFAAGVCLAILGCGPSEPASPLILGSDGEDAARGLRTLTSEQGVTLQNLILSAGAPCDGVVAAYLRDIDAGRFESWDVRCPGGAYTVHVFADGTEADVERCLGWSVEGCEDPFSSRRFRQYPDRQAPPGQLNPDLGKLLEQMDKEGGKKD